MQLDRGEGCCCLRHSPARGRAAGLWDLAVIHLDVPKFRASGFSHPEQWRRGWVFGFGFVFLPFAGSLQLEMSHPAPLQRELLFISCCCKGKCSLGLVGLGKAGSRLSNPLSTGFSKMGLLCPNRGAAVPSTTPS